MYSRKIHFCKPNDINGLHLLKCKMYKSHVVVCDLYIMGYSWVHKSWVGFIGFGLIHWPLINS